MCKILVSLVLLSGFIAHAQKTVPAVFLSDIHFDPFADPAKVDALRSARVEEWDTIFRAPESPHRAADSKALQDACGVVKGIDTPWPLLAASLAAQKAAVAAPLFVTVSGDMMAHRFDCFFAKLAPTASKGDYAVFAAKTIAFLAWELHHTFPQAAIYLALGNNDSSCRDYREDPGSIYLRDNAITVARASLDHAHAAAIEASFTARGDYSAMLPAPFAKTRLIVVQDMLASNGFASCANVKSSTGAEQQIAWLRAQLAEARAHHEHVWVMGHIPPGVNPHGEASAAAVACEADAKRPAEFLRDESLLDAITDNADIITLALFGHTHMDEIRLLRGRHGAIPMKISPAMTTIGGNLSAFTFAQVDPKTAVVVDYAVYNASTKSGEGPWVREYDYAQSYGKKDFSASSVDALLSSFRADPKAAGPGAATYIRFFETGLATGPGGMPGARANDLRGIWPEYSCGISTGHAADYKACLCAKETQ